MIIDIFKTTIYKTSVHNVDYYNYFINLLNNSFVKKEGKIISNKGGFQTNNFIFDLNNSENKNIVDNLFINPVSNFISNFKPKKEITISSCDFWINKNFQILRFLNSYWFFEILNKLIEGIRILIHFFIFKDIFLFQSFC